MKYTIAIPAYKSRFLKECIESILNQTLQDFELIIVDDASPEPINAIVSQFNDSRISYYRNKQNTGAINVVDNWNKCLSLAKGEYFCLMGDDDLMDKTYLTEMDKLTKDFPQIEVFHGRTMEIDEFSQKKHLYEAWPSWQCVYDLIWHRMARLRVTFISDFIFKTQTLKDLGGFHKLPMAWASDDISVYRTASTHGIAATNNVVLYYRRHDTSITSIGKTEPKLLAINEEARWLKEFIQRARPINDTERILCKMIKERLNTHINYRRSLEICQAWRGKKFKTILKLIYNSKQYELHLPIIIKGILMAFANKN